MSIVTDPKRRESLTTYRHSQENLPMERGWHRQTIDRLCQDTRDTYFPQITKILQTWLTNTYKTPFCMYSLSAMSAGGSTAMCKHCSKMCEVLCEQKSLKWNATTVKTVNHRCSCTICTGLASVHGPWTEQIPICDYHISTVFILLIFITVFAVFYSKFHSCIYITSLQCLHFTISYIWLQYL